MRKIISLILIMILTLGVAAFAETAGTENTAVADQPVGTKEAAEPETTAEAETSAEPTAQLTKGPGRLAGLIIGIDPGHQAHQNSGKELVSPKGKEKKAKVSSGTQGSETKIPEYQTVLEISLQLRDALEAEGATVVMTRETNDVDISNYERAMLMNDAKADLVLRIHCDGSTSHKNNGIACYVRKSIAYSKKIVPEPKKLLEAEATAAKDLVNAMCEATGAKNNGVMKRDSYTMNNWSTVPIILVETGYMTNYDEDVKLNDPDYQALLVKGMVNGVEEYFGR